MFIDRCINSILNQDLPTQEWELILVDGMSTDNTRQLIEPYLRQYSNIILHDNPNKTAPYAMNIGIKAAQGEYIVRIDAHAQYPKNYVSSLVNYLKTLPDATNVGYRFNTLPANDSKKAKAIAIALTHRFGVGSALFRTNKVISPTIVDTVPFGCWRKSLFDSIGMFDEDLTRGQDYEFNARILAHYGKIYLLPNLEIDYYVRETLLKTCKMYYQYGLFKPLANHKLARPATLRQFVPPIFLAGLILGPIIGIFWKPVLIIYLAILLFYVLTLVFLSIKYKNFYLTLAFPAIHLSYGAGYWNGLFKLLLGLPFAVTSSR